MDSGYVYGEVKLQFKLDGKLADATLKYQYYPDDDNLKYIDITYSSLKLQERIENDPDMMKKVDLYVRNMLSKN